MCSRRNNHFPVTVVFNCVLNGYFVKTVSLLAEGVGFGVRWSWYIEMNRKSSNKKWLYKNRERWLYHGSISTAKCAECGERLLFFHKYDAYCCARCNIWHDSKCKDVNCEFCADRPDAPNIELYEFDEYYHFDRKSFYQRKCLHRLKHQNHRKRSRELQCSNIEKR